MKSVLRISLHPLLRGYRKVNFVVALTVISFTSCKPLFDTSTYISKQEAIDAALEIASTSRPEVSGAQVTPYNIALEQMTLDEAVKHINSKNEVAAGYDPDMTVWFVRMEGIWLDEFPRPEGFPTPPRYHHYAVILDALTGLGIEVSVSP
jgi:hypothetical protein